MVRACLRGERNKVVKNVEGSQAARQQSEREMERETARWKRGRERSNERRRKRIEKRTMVVAVTRESLWCGGALGFSASATRFESQRSEALRLQNGVKTQ